MTMYSPTLELRKLSINGSGKTLYKQQFHKGVNIIRGQNGTGKSTILNFIYYALGGELNEWKDAAKKCDEVIATFSINKSLITLARIVAPELRPPVTIFWGDQDDPGAADRAKWQQFPIRKSKDKESITQVLFRSLGIPEVPYDENSSLTIHQILRLMYVDQMSPVTSLFRREQFDLPLIRETVGNLICGALDPSLLNDQLDLRDLEKDISSLKAEIKSYERILSSFSKPITKDWLTSEENEIKHRKTELENKLEIISKSQKFDPKITINIDKSELINEAASLKEDLESKRFDISRLEFEIKDSDKFIKNLEYKLTSLTKSEFIRKSFGGFSAGICPMCLSEIESSTDDSICPLCKKEIINQYYDANFLKMKQELSNQLKESKEIQAERVNFKQELIKKIQKIETDVKAFETRWSGLIPIENNALYQEKELFIELGELSEKLKHIDELKLIFEKLESSTQIINSKNSEAQTLRSQIQIKVNAQEDAKILASDAIVKNVTTLLKLDLGRQEEFRDPKNIVFSWRDDKIYIDNQNSFAASSIAYLKNIFFLGLLKSSLDSKQFLYPRFLMLDNIEDKGLEITRSHNLQDCLIKMSQKCKKIDHQIIFTTSMINPAYDIVEYVIGPSYTTQSRTLAF